MAQLQTERTRRVEAWLASGGVVLTANDRASRSIAAAFHSARRTDGLSAWPTPAVTNLDIWVRDRWLERNAAGMVLLNPLQERSLWSRVVRTSRAGETLLHPDRLAAAAQRAYRLMCNYAPESLARAARLSWSGDAAIFSEWLAAFEDRCRRESLISPSRLIPDLTARLQSDLAAQQTNRTPLLLIGFDRLLPTQIDLLNAWGDWQPDEPQAISPSQQFLAAPDFATELSACVEWLHQQLASQPQAKLMIVTTSLDSRRGEIERALLANPQAPISFEFSLGAPLAQTSVARSALLLLRWLHEPLTEAELDWLIASGHSAATADEAVGLAETMRSLRRKGLERTEWPLEAFLGPEAPQQASLFPVSSSTHPPASWSSRLRAAHSQLQQAAGKHSPIDCVTLACRLLETTGWPGFRPLSSTGFQARQRWQAMLESCATLAFDGSLMDWSEFLAALATALSETIFATESTEASVLITEPLESAGQLVDGIWFLGADEEAWPASGALHPLLPIWLQRNSGMPHATPQADWDLAHQATSRLLSSATQIVFSHARQGATSDNRPSRLVTRLIGLPTALPQYLQPNRQFPDPILETFADTGQILFTRTTIRGGAAVLTSQSICPFQAFATARLEAQDWQPAEAGLNAKQRGQLLHAVLHRVWNKAEGGLSSLDELRTISSLPAFVHPIAGWAIREQVSSALRETLPTRFLFLEQERLTRLVAGWLAYELNRCQFTVSGTEVNSDITIAGLSLSLRLDRIDQLADGSKLVIDYKSSDVGPSAWMGPRPDDVQLPIYATFAVPDQLQGLVFARVKPGKIEFTGRARQAKALLNSALSPQTSLIKNPLTDAQLGDWRSLIIALGNDFLDGRAEVSPKDGQKTCDKCRLQAVCRIYENAPLSALEPADEEEDTPDSD